MFFRHRCTVRQLPLTPPGDGPLRWRVNATAEHVVIVTVRPTDSADIAIAEADAEFRPADPILHAFDARDAEMREGTAQAPPQTLRLFADQTATELRQALRRVVDVLRWRLALVGPHQPLQVVALEWSIDGSTWWPLDLKQTSRGPASGTHVTPALRDEVQSLLDAKLDAPLGHRLWLEAWEQRHASPRGALLIGVAAIEVGVKQTVARLDPAAEWLVSEIPTPPLTRILSEYLPGLAKQCGTRFGISEEERRTLKSAVQLRNRVAHVGDATIAHGALEEALALARQLLWRLDAVAGHPFAEARAVDATISARAEPHPAAQSPPTA